LSNKFQQNLTKKLKLVAIESDSNEIALFGTKSIFEELSFIINVSKNHLMYSLTIPINPPPMPYKAFLNFLRFEVTENKVEISNIGDVLTIKGSSETLEIFSDNINFFANRKPHETMDITKKIKDHMHIEYFPDNFYIDVSSKPLVCYLLGEEWI